MAFRPQHLASPPSGLGDSRLSSRVTRLQSQTQLTAAGWGQERRGPWLCSGGKGKLEWRWDVEPAVEKVCEWEMGGTFPYEARPTCLLTETL